MCVAVIRSGNKQAVNRCKVSWFINNGKKYQLCHSYQLSSFEMCGKPGLSMSTLCMKTFSKLHVEVNESTVLCTQCLE